MNGVLEQSAQSLAHSAPGSRQGHGAGTRGTPRSSSRRGSAGRLARAALVALCGSSVACESGSAVTAAPGAKGPPAASAGSVTPPEANARAVGQYGAPLQPGTSVPLATLLANPRAYANQTVTTEGKVQRACSRKGCWMELGDGASACRVTFKDYAFFVPTDSAGSYAKVQGRLDTREVEAAAVAHLEAEGARFSNKRPDGSATEVQMVASAVELRR